MKLTIIPSDGAVYKDGYSYSGLSLTGVPKNVHALQWDGEAGWIEFVSESEFRKPANQIIDALPDWASASVVAWQAAKSKFEAVDRSHVLPSRNTTLSSSRS